MQIGGALFSGYRGKCRTIGRSQVGAPGGRGRWFILRSFPWVGTLDLGNWEKKCMVEGGCASFLRQKKKKWAARLVLGSRGWQKIRLTLGVLDCVPCCGDPMIWLRRNSFFFHKTNNIDAMYTQVYTPSICNIKILTIIKLWINTVIRCQNIFLMISERMDHIHFFLKLTIITFYTWVLTCICIDPLSFACQVFVLTN